jgi:hypothetical protein
MMKLNLKRILFLLLLAQSLSVYAVGNFAGHWISESGKVTSNIGVNGNCSKIEIVITQDSSAVVTKSYHAECGTYSSDWGPVPEDIHGGKIFENGDEVGTIDETTLKTSAPDSGVIYNYNLSLMPSSQGSEKMHSLYGTQNFVGSITIEADMVRVP